MGPEPGPCFLPGDLRPPPPPTSPGPRPGATLGRYTVWGQRGIFVGRGRDAGKHPAVRASRALPQERWAARVRGPVPEEPGCGVVSVRPSGSGTLKMGPLRPREGKGFLRSQGESGTEPSPGPMGSTPSACSPLPIRHRSPRRAASAGPGTGYALGPAWPGVTITAWLVTITAWLVRTCSLLAGGRWGHLLFFTLPSRA